MKLRTQTHAGRSRRSGTLTIELMLVLPILVLVIGGMVQFSMVLTARQQLLAASREGARVAARGGDAKEVQAAVKQSLGNGNLGDATVQMRVVPEDPARPNRNRERVEVCVRVAEGHVAPNFLAWILRTEDDELIACTVMHRE